MNLFWCINFITLCVAVLADSTGPITVPWHTQFDENTELGALILTTADEVIVGGDSVNYVFNNEQTANSPPTGYKGFFVGGWAASNGHMIWGSQFFTHANYHLKDVAVDNDTTNGGSVYVAGVGGSGSYTNNDVVATKLSADRQSILWSFQLGSDKEDECILLVTQVVPSLLKTMGPPTYSF